MTFPHKISASGALFMRRPSLANVTIDWAGIADLQIARADPPGWTAMTLTSAEPLNHEIQMDRAQIFAYHFLLRAGQDNRFLLVADVQDMVEVLLKRSKVRAHFTSPRIDTLNLTKTLAAQPGRYSMSAVHAEINGYGSALRTASFFGQDLADALLFVELLPQLAAYRVGLRDIATKTEVMSVGARGQVAFGYSGPASLRQVDRALQFLTQRRFLDWDHLNPHDESS